MVHTQSNIRARILDFARRLAPYSVIDIGVQYSLEGHVVECYRSANRIHGVVRGNDQQAMFTVGLDVHSSHKISAECTCARTEDLQEQWCQHAVALLLRACDLGFFNTDSGFAAHEATFRMNTSTPADVAAIMQEMSQLAPPVGSVVGEPPAVDIELDLRSDRLGVRISFDGETQGPAIFEAFSRHSSRALDNILVKLLDEEGSWDDEQRLWYVNASPSIELVLGLIQEYTRVTVAGTKQRVSFGRDPLDAELELVWQEHGLQLSMWWLQSNGERSPREGDLLGTGPYWALVQGRLQRLLPSAARIASIFPHRASLTFSRAQVAPILEALHDGSLNRDRLRIVHPELQPAVEIAQPTIAFELRRRDSSVEHFASSERLEVDAVLTFQYPEPPRGANVVFLPNREIEKDAIEKLKSLGFAWQPERRVYAIAGDSALDLLASGTTNLPADWNITGLEHVRRGIKFAELSMNLAVSASSAETSSANGKTDWFDCHVSLVQNNANVPISTIFRGARGDADRWIRLDSGAYARIPGGSISNLKTTLGIIDPNFRLSNTIRARVSAAQAVSLSRIDDQQFDLSLDKKISALSEKLRHFERIKPVAVPAAFHGKLRSYQAEGVSWLNFLDEFSFGGILADEMGLGKTVQALALIQHLRTRRGARATGKPVLVVAPTSVLTNWLYEAQRFTPKLKSLVLHGPGRKQHFATLDTYDIVITSYALLRLDRQELERTEFSVIFLDEAQNIKNPQAATTRAAKSLRGRTRFALTGTPTENRPMELWSIMDFLMPGYLGSYDFFRTHIERPILEGGPSVEVTRLLNQKTRPFILRRTKAEVEKDLPPKIESVVYADMTESQRALYNQIVEEVRPRVMEAVERKGIRGASVSILAALLRLRQVCNHPNSIESLKELEGFESGKFNVLRDLVTEALESGRKILLFSQFLEMLAIIRRWLDERGDKYVYLDGATTNRQDLVDQFNTDTSVRLFLISLKAGGTGLNLTAADTIVIYDPWWNPAVENQAVDRAHRIGQNKTVSVYRLVTVDSVEQKIMALKQKKSKIVDALINETGLSAARLSRDDLEQLFSPLPG